MIFIKPGITLEYETSKGGHNYQLLYYIVILNQKTTKRVVVLLNFSLVYIVYL